MIRFIQINNNKIKQIRNFAKEVIKTKINENGYRYDNKKLYKRFYNGMLGEVAVEQFLDRSFIDWTIGQSRLYNRADLTQLGLNIGIKSVEYGKLPLVKKRPQRAEIINLIMNDNTVMIGGYASIFDLMVFSNDEMILSPYVKKKGVKTAFDGLHMLIPFNDIEELRNIDNIFSGEVNLAEKYKNVI